MYYFKRLMRAYVIIIVVVVVLIIVVVVVFLVDHDRELRLLDSLTFGLLRIRLSPDGSLLGVTTAV